MWKTKLCRLLVTKIKHKRGSYYFIYMKAKSFYLLINSFNIFLDSFIYCYDIESFFFFFFFSFCNLWNFMYVIIFSYILLHVCMYFFFDKLRTLQYTYTYTYTYTYPYTYRGLIYLIATHMHTLAFLDLISTICMNIN